MSLRLTSQCPPSSDLERLSTSQNPFLQVQRALAPTPRTKPSLPSISLHFQIRLHSCPPGLCRRGTGILNQKDQGFLRNLLSCRTLHARSRYIPRIPIRHNLEAVEDSLDPRSTHRLLLSIRKLCRFSTHSATTIAVEVSSNSFVRATRARRAWSVPMVTTMEILKPW